MIQDMSPAGSHTELPEETTLDERDERYLRKAIVWSHAARRRGKRPFGSVIVTTLPDVAP